MKVELQLPHPAAIKVFFENFISCENRFCLHVVSESMINIIVTNLRSDFVARMNISEGVIVTHFSGECMITYLMSELYHLISVVGSVNELFIDINSDMATMSTKSRKLVRTRDTYTDIKIDTPQHTKVIDSKKFTETMSRMCILSRDLVVHGNVWSTRNKYGEYIVEDVGYSLSDSEITFPIKYVKVCSSCTKMAPELTVGVNSDYMIIIVHVMHGFTIECAISKV